MKYSRWRTVLVLDKRDKYFSDIAKSGMFLILVYFWILQKLKPLIKSTLFQIFHFPPPLLPHLFQLTVVLQQHEVELIELKVVMHKDWQLVDIPR